VRIGRSPDNEVQIDHLAVSRHHAVVEVQAGETVILRDLGSNNGTFLNGMRVEGTHPLRNGDGIQIGPFDIEVGGDGPARGMPGRVGSGEDWMAPIPVTLRREDHETRERTATVKAFLVLNNAPGPPRLLEKDIYQFGKDAGCDVRLEGIFAPRKLAVIVRGHGGWKLLNVTTDGKRVERNGAPVPDQCWLESGDKLVIGELEVEFHEGTPMTQMRTEATPRLASVPGQPPTPLPLPRPAPFSPPPPPPPPR
jgi:pSer/pThr/pTyr-binding forkhead associated (FHA) protein